MNLRPRPVGGQARIGHGMGEGRGEGVGRDGGRGGRSGPGGGKGARGVADVDDAAFLADFGRFPDQAVSAVARSERTNTTKFQRKNARAPTGIASRMLLKTGTVQSGAVVPVPW